MDEKKKPVQLSIANIPEEPREKAAPAKRKEKSLPERQEFTLRPYQQAAVDAVPEKGRVMLVLATGLGKTVIFSHIKRYGRTLILSHRDELVRQPVRCFPPEISVGIEKAGEHSHGEDVISASVQTLARGDRLEKTFKPGDFHTVIIDEAHHAAAKSYRKIIDYLKPVRLVGVTATPRRGDHVRLNDIFDSIVFERDIKWGIRNGWLAGLKCERADVGIQLKNVRTNGRKGDFLDGSLEQAVNRSGINEAVAEVYEKEAIKPALIFTAGVSHAKSLKKLIKGSEVVTGKTPESERKLIIERFLAGRVPCLINCGVFTEGTDLPNVRTVIIARPTKNISLYTQMVGRGLRKTKDKSECLLIDCATGVDVKSICTAPTLLGVRMSDVPEKKISGDVMKISRKLEMESDSVHSWIRNIQTVEEWAADEKYDTHGVNYSRRYDGSMFVMCREQGKPGRAWEITAPDALGNAVLTGYDISGGKANPYIRQEMPMQRALDHIYDTLMRHYPDSRKLWDARLVKKWRPKPATEKQKALIASLYRSLYGKGVSEAEIGRMSSAQGAQVISRLFFEKYTRQAARNGRQAQ